MNRDAWPGWFDRVNRSDAAKVHAGLKDVLDDMERRLSHR